MNLGIKYVAIHQCALKSSVGANENGRGGSVAFFGLMVKPKMPTGARRANPP
jgi:hypothetical protein